MPVRVGGEPDRAGLGGIRQRESARGLREERKTEDWKKGQEIVVMEGELRAGMEVEAVFAEERKGSMLDVKYFTLVET